MSTKIVPEEMWDMRVAQLLHAMCGTITPTFRMITFEHDGEEWVLKVYIERESDDDMEEIDDILCSLDAVILPREPYSSYRYETIITDAPLPMPEKPVEVVFKRRER
jgi:ribosome maturation factor RimP